MATTTLMMNSGIERSVLHTMMWRDANEVMAIITGCREEFFSDGQNGLLFRVLKERYDKGLSLMDLPMIAQELKAAGSTMTISDLFAMNDNVPLALDIAENIRALRDMYIRRQLKMKMQFFSTLFDDLTTDVEESLGKLTEALSTTMGLSEQSTVRLTDVLVKLHDIVKANQKENAQESMLTGFKELDIYGGMHPCDLVVIAADSSQGKTALAITMVVNAARLSGAKVAIYSMEMSGTELGARILSPETNMPASVILYRSLKEKGLQEVEKGMEKLNTVGDNIFFGDESTQSIESIIASIRLHHIRYGVRLVVVDYLQIVNFAGGKESSREEQLAQGARRLKNIAKELGICVLLLSQLNRDISHMGSMEPTASRLRGSGQINEAADMTLMVYRPEVYGLSYPTPFTSVPTKDTAMLKIEKDRHGGYGGVRSFIVGFEGRTTKFGGAPVGK